MLVAMTSTLDDQALDALAARIEQGQVSDPAQLLAVIDDLRACRGRIQNAAQRDPHQVALLALTRSEAIGAGELEPALREITEVAATILGVGRSSVWRFNADKSEISCLELYRAKDGAHESGTVLSQTDYPDYFRALLEARMLAVHDAHTDPRTAEFSQGYLTPLGINSMLDVPIRVGGRMVGVICNEHTGPARNWTSSDQQFAGGLADFIALALESHARHQTQTELRSMVEVAEQRLDMIEHQRQAIAALSAPIIDVWDGILAVPIVGLVDTQRSIELTERLLNRISATGAQAVIVDLTGVEVVDTMTADHLLQMIRAATLLGTSCVLSGISPQIAQTLVHLGVELDQITTVRTLKHALETCLRQRFAAHGG